MRRIITYFIDKFLNTYRYDVITKSLRDVSITFYGWMHGEEDGLKCRYDYNIIILQPYICILGMRPVDDCSDDKLNSIYIYVITL